MADRYISLEWLRKTLDDRGVSHEIVRHRLAAFCQESTRYCNYGKDGFGGEITVIRPSTYVAPAVSRYGFRERHTEKPERRTDNG